MKKKKLRCIFIWLSLHGSQTWLYLNKTKQAELASANAGLDEDEIAALPINRRALTNLGTFRAYCQAYLEESSRFRNDMTLMVRQLAPSAQGLPLEIYAFTNDTNWVRYEGIQSDLIDHLLSVLPFFELKVFQNPTGADFSKNLGPRYPISEDKRTKIDS